MTYRWLLFILLLGGPATAFAQIAFDTLMPYYRDTLFFDSGQAILQETAADQLNWAYSQWQPPAQVHLTGHTDAIGSAQSNIALAQRRVEAVARELMLLGLPDTAIYTDIYGETRPVAANSQESGRQKNRRVTLGIYGMQRVIPLKGRISDAETGKGIPARIRFHGKGFEHQIQTDTSGRYRYLLPEGAIIGREIFAKGYFFKSEMFKAVYSDLPEANMVLDKAEEGRSMDIPDFYFYGGQDVLLPKSVLQLANLKTFMDISPEVRIEIEGHINQPNKPPVAKGSREFQLSIDRAKLVYEYLLARGIDASRLQYKGYGSSRMRFPKAIYEEDQAANRRVEIRVLK